jgi:hypothetical protein
VAEPDPKWTAERWALGDVDGIVQINVAGNSAASSSILPMLDRHHGFELVGLVPGFADSETGQLLAFDGVFMRPRPREAH